MRDDRRLLVMAPPGAGKTTEVPPLLLDQPWATGTVIVTQPRRIAARLAASYIAGRRGEALGETIGYRVRMDEKVGDKTRLVFETEGLFLRRILSGGGLSNVSAVVIDEVHERSQAADCLISLVQREQRTRTDLRLLLMSATLDAQNLAAALDDAPVIESLGRSFPVDVTYQDKPDERPLAIQVRMAIAETQHLPGDVLVFLPGAREIRSAMEALERVAGYEVLPLHGDLPIAQQARATAGSGEHPRIILSTNVAESSVTIPGVTKVIDSGLARVARHDPLSGASRLQTEEVSQARLIQRAGRAGRLAPGRCLRLFSRGSFERRPPQELPEILRADLSEMLLLLKNAGLEATNLAWPSPPDQTSWAQAEELLSELGALSAGELTDIGRKMAQLPLPPRLARVVVEGHRLGRVSCGCRAAALLSEKDIKRQTRFATANRSPETFSDSDIDDRFALLDLAEGGRLSSEAQRREGLDPQGVRTVLLVQRRLERICHHWQAPKEPPVLDDERALKTCLLAGFFDRVAERRGTGRHLVLASGAQALLAEESAVSQAPFLLAIASGGSAARGGTPIIRLAARIDPDELLELAPERISCAEEASYDRRRDRVDLRSRITYGKVVLSEDVSRAPPGPLLKQALLSEAQSRGEAIYDPEGRLEALGVRLTLLREAASDLLTSLGEQERLLLELSHPELCQHALESALDYSESIAQLRETDLAELLLSSTGANLGRILSEQLPEKVTLPSGVQLRIVYARGAPPHVASRLQDFFSMSETPTLLSGRVPLQLHLLAPNRRAIQVTTDLGGFWQRHYPQLRKALMRRYPKHSWPEDGLTAPPPRPGRLR